MHTQLLLASASPRRQRLLSLLGLPYTTLAAEVDETPLPEETPRQLASRLAWAKAETVAAHAGGNIVVAADSVVVLAGRALGKPGSVAEATAMLRRLRARRHQVLTGVALLATTDGDRYGGLVCTEVVMRRYSDAEIVAYVRSGSPMDKAGGYGIQDVSFSPVERISGCYLNVVGLPLCEVVRGLAALGCAPDWSAGEAFTPPCRLCGQGAALF